MAVWTKKKPMQEGWYWWKRDGSDPQIVKIFKVPFSVEWQIGLVGNPDSIPLSMSHKNNEWHGPIAKP